MFVLFSTFVAVACILLIAVAWIGANFHPNGKPPKDATDPNWHRPFIDECELSESGRVEAMVWLRGVCLHITFTCRRRNKEYTAKDTIVDLTSPGLMGEFQFVHPDHWTPEVWQCIRALQDHVEPRWDAVIDGALDGMIGALQKMGNEPQITHRALSRAENPNLSAERGLSQMNWGEEARPEPIRRMWHTDPGVERPPMRVASA